jgi:hypothetical protein
MKPYILLLLGRQTDKGDLDIAHSTECWHQITIALYESFKALGINIIFHQVHYPNEIIWNDLPKADAVLFLGLTESWEELKKDKVRQVTSCKKLFTICEFPLISGADWSFSFGVKSSGERITLIPLPIYKKLYQNIPKITKSIMVDHWQADNNWDWTYKIEEWLEEMKDEFMIYRQVQDEPSVEVGERQARISPYLKQLKQLSFLEYLKATDTLETFIVTHYESYGYGILDMIARGIRVVVPDTFIHTQYADLYMPKFSDKQSLLNILRTPPDEEGLKSNIRKLTDYSEVVRIIDEQIRRMI